jgi:hypothetical protein
MDITAEQVADWLRERLTPEQLADVAAERLLAGDLVEIPPDWPVDVVVDGIALLSDAAWLAASAEHDVTYGEDLPRFAPGDLVRGIPGHPEADVARVVACDLHGCTLEDGARYSPERLELVAVE